MRREFLGEVRCLVFDPHAAAEDRERTVRWADWGRGSGFFHRALPTGSYGPASPTSYYFSFDSWRVECRKAKQWLPALIYSQQGDFQDAQTKNMAFKTIQAMQTRLWGYCSWRHWGSEQELTKVLVETPVKDQAG